MQGSAADIIKVAMLNSHSVITNGSNTVDSMDGLMQNFSQIRGRCHLLLQVFYNVVITHFSRFLFIYFLNIDSLELCFAFCRCMMNLCLKLTRLW